MKKGKSYWKMFLLTFLLLTLCVGLNSCGDEDSPMIHDFRPVTINLKLVDAEGADLLVEGDPGSWFGKNISITYDGEVYEAKWDGAPMPPYETRYYLAVFKGFYLYKPYEGEPILIFGEFDGATDQHIECVLKIEGDPTEYNIERTHSVKWKHDSPHVYDETIVNGMRLPNELITITLPPAK